ANCCDHIDLAVDEAGGQCGQSIILVFGPAVFDRQVFSLDVSGFAQSLTERGETRQCLASGRPWVEVADHRHRVLLRAERAPRRHRTPRQEQHFAPVHRSVPAGARARIDGGRVGGGAWGVLGLTTSSRVVGFWPGRAAGLALLRTLPTYPPAKRYEP